MAISTSPATDTNPNALKHLFGKALLKRMSGSLGSVYPAFQKSALVKLMPSMESLEMKARIHLIREELARQLPSDYRVALPILLESVREGSLRGFDLWPYSDYIQTHGLEHWSISLAALRELTPLFTSEFSIRPFLVEHPQPTLDFLLRCAKDKDVDLRRWASEGSRPRLPWGLRLKAFIENPETTLPILEQLRFDRELYVRKSVANHLNDIAKDHPDRVIALLNRWKKEAGADQVKDITWIIRHALRSLIKAGHPQALMLIDVDTKAKVELSSFKANKKNFVLGDKIDFTCLLRSTSPRRQKLVVDYVVHYAKARGKSTVKVFKLKTLEIAPRDEIAISKVHHLKEVTTRVHYSGVHYLDIQVNGVILHRFEWKLRV